MIPDRKTPEELLLDWHLDRLDGEERSWVEAQLRSDAKLRAESDRLRRLLEPLDHWQVSPGPTNLADRVLSYVERSTAEGSELAPAVPAGDSYAPWRFPRLRDFVAVAACLLLLLGVFVPGVSELRDRSRRVVCANNLGSICRGTSLYQQAFAGSLPYAGGVQNASWLPGGAAGRPYASNSRHPFLLVKLKFGPGLRDFICPAASDGEAMKLADLGTADDFALARNVGYDTLNLGGATPNLRPRAAIAYAADRNPLFIGARFNEEADPDKANSPAHGRRGQTVLSLDGCAMWSTTPLHGPRRDNVWLIRNVRRYTGTEAATRDDDAFLVPGYPLTDPLVREGLRR